MSGGMMDAVRIIRTLTPHIWEITMTTTPTMTTIPLDDKKTYDLLARAEAVGIFQLESQGMRRALLDMKPDRFEDIIALVALYRPGPMANIPTYCARKHGEEEPDYIHPKLESILKETYGIMVYQEQVMQAAQALPPDYDLEPTVRADTNSFSAIALFE